MEWRWEDLLRPGESRLKKRWRWPISPETELRRWHQAESWRSIVAALCSTRSIKKEYVKTFNTTLLVLLRSKSMSGNIVNLRHFNATFNCCNILWGFESDSKTSNTVAQFSNVALAIVSCNIPLPTIAATKLCLKLSRVRRFKKSALKIGSCKIT